MKFLVLALFVCAANGATFDYPRYGGQNKFSSPSRFTNRVTATPVYTAKAEAIVNPVGVPQPVVNPVVPVPVPAPTPVVPKSVVFESNPEIVYDSRDIRPDGYNYKFENNDGTGAEAVGTLKTVGDVDFLTVSGSYKYRNEDGKEILVTYTADEDGYHPQSDVIPVAPPVPEVIARALKYIASVPKYDEPTKKY